MKLITRCHSVKIRSLKFHSFIVPRLPEESKRFLALFQKNFTARNCEDRGAFPRMPNPVPLHKEVNVGLLAVPRLHASGDDHFPVIFERCRNVVHIPAVRPFKPDLLGTGGRIPAFPVRSKQRLAGFQTAVDQLSHLVPLSLPFFCHYVGLSCNPVKGFHVTGPIGHASQSPSRKPIKWRWSPQCSRFRERLSKFSGEPIRQTPGDAAPRTRRRSLRGSG